MYHCKNATLLTLYICTCNKIIIQIEYFQCFLYFSSSFLLNQVWRCLYIEQDLVCPFGQVLYTGCFCYGVFCTIQSMLRKQIPRFCSNFQETFSKSCAMIKTSWLLKQFCMYPLHEMLSNITRNRTVSNIPTWISPWYNVYLIIQMCFYHKMSKRLLHCLRYSKHIEFWNFENKSL